jgi:hypothetical protein
MSAPDRRALLDRGHDGLSIRRQCALLSVARSGAYRTVKPANDDDLALMQRIDELFLRYPFAGSRRLTHFLRAEGMRVKRKRVQRLIGKIGIAGAVDLPQGVVREAKLRSILAAGAAGVGAGAAVVALAQVRLQPPDAAALAAAMRRESAQQITARSHEVAEVRRDLGRKAATLSLQTVVGSIYVAGGQRGELVMTCPVPSQPVAGGIKDQDDTWPLREVESFPDGDRWVVRVVNAAAQGQHAMVGFVLAPPCSLRRAAARANSTADCARKEGARWRGSTCG